VMQRQCIENPEAVKKWGDLADWHHAVGTGPFILKNFVPNNEALLVKDPNYWGHDERYPQNKVPYMDSIKYAIITDDNAALEAMRAGKSISWTGFPTNRQRDPQDQPGNPGDTESDDTGSNRAAEERYSAF